MCQYLIFKSDISEKKISECTHRTKARYFKELDKGDINIYSANIKLSCVSYGELADSCHLLTNLLTLKVVMCVMGTIAMCMTPS